MALSPLTPYDSCRLAGVSVNRAPGRTVEELTASIPNKQVRVTTVGAIRAAGGDVIPDPRLQEIGVREHFLDRLPEKGKKLGEIRVGLAWH